MKRLQESWLDYRRRCVPADASETQVSETRKAFYGGAAIAFGAITGAMDPTPADTEPTERELDVLTDFKAELEAYLAELVEHAKAAATSPRGD